MPWAKLDDQAHKHRKQLAAGLEAVGFWAMALSYCSDYRTNGTLTPTDIGLVYAKISEHRARQLAERLVAVGLFEAHGEGWVVHDFLDYNPTADKAAAVSEVRAEAGAVGGRRSGEARRSKREANASANGKHTGSTSGSTREAKTNPDPDPDPVPDPDPRREEPTPVPPEPTSGEPPTVGCINGRLAHQAGLGPPSLAKSAATWDAYRDAYQARYGVPPRRNRDVNRDLVRLVDKLGAEEAPAVAAFYLRHNGGWYVQHGHATRWLVTDAEKLRTEWATGHTITATTARQADRLESLRDAAEQVKAENRARRAQEKP